LRKFHGYKLFSDKWTKNPGQTHEPLRRKTIFSLWFTLVRQKQALTSEQFQGAFPEISARIQLWDECIDENMKPSLNYDQYWEHIKKRIKEKRMALQIAKAQKKGAKKF